MIYPLSEIFDRLTIETRKSHYGAKNLKLRRQYVQSVAERLGTHAANIIMAVIELTVANVDIANLEWAIRANKGLKPSEVGRRALAIRDINALRIDAKSHLARYLGERVDVKRYDQKQSFTSILQPVGPAGGGALLVDGEVMKITKYDVPNQRITVVRGKRGKIARSRKGRNS